MREVSDAITWERWEGTIEYTFYGADLPHHPSRRLLLFRYFVWFATNRDCVSGDATFLSRAHRPKSSQLVDDVSDCARRESFLYRNRSDGGDFSTAFARKGPGGNRNPPIGYFVDFRGLLRD